MDQEQTLFDISEELQKLMNEIEIDYETGEIISGSIDEIDALYEDFEEKAQDCVNYIRRTAAEAELSKLESEKIKAYSKTLENKAEWMANYVKDMMQRVGMKKVVVGGRPASIAKNPPSVVVDKELLPTEWFRQVVRPEPDKKRIKEHIVNGGDAPQGVTYVENKFRLKY